MHEQINLNHNLYVEGYYALVEFWVSFPYILAAKW